MKDKSYKTVKGYLSAVRKLEKNTIMCLKGYDKLTKSQQYELGYLSASISNTLSDFDDVL